MNCVTVCDKNDSASCLKKKSPAMRLPNEDLTHDDKGDTSKAGVAAFQFPKSSRGCHQHKWSRAGSMTTHGFTKGYSVSQEHQHTEAVGGVTA